MYSYRYRHKSHTKELIFNIYKMLRFKYTFHISTVDGILWKPDYSIYALYNTSYIHTSRVIPKLHSALLLKTWIRHVPLNLVSSLAATYSPFGSKNGTSLLSFALFDLIKFHLCIKWRAMSLAGGPV